MNIENNRYGFPFLGIVYRLWHESRGKLYKLIIFSPGNSSMMKLNITESKRSPGVCTRSNTDNPHHQSYASTGPGLIEDTQGLPGGPFWSPARVFLEQEPMGFSLVYVRPVYSTCFPQPGYCLQFLTFLRILLSLRVRNWGKSMRLRERGKE